MKNPVLQFFPHITRTGRRCNIFTLAGLICFLVAAALPVTGHAAAGDWTSGNHVKARLISGVQSIAGQPHIDAGIQIRLEEGWYTYWRHAGAAGLPPRFDWTESQNLASVDVDWPAPERKEIMDMQSFVYPEEVIFPLQVFAGDKDTALTMELELNLMVCKSICVPEQLHLSLSLPAAPIARQSPQARLIETAREKVPHKGNLRELKIENVVLSDHYLVATVYAARGLDNVDIFVEYDDKAFIAKPEMLVTGKGENGAGDDTPARKALFRFESPEPDKKLDEVLDGRQVKITLVNRNTAIEREFSF